jgi:hypothetical protein
VAIQLLRLGLSGLVVRFSRSKRRFGIKTPKHIEGLYVIFARNGRDEGANDGNSSARFRGFFDAPEESEDLEITVRIVCEFFVFLQQSNDVPELGEAQYMAGTIRSGLDWFFSIAQIGRILTGLKLQSGFGPRLPSTFSELKASYDSTFHQVLESTHSIEAMGLLLSLVQMMFLFMTVYFPSFLSFSSDSGSN